MHTLSSRKPPARNNSNKRALLHNHQPNNTEDKKSSVEQNSLYLIHHPTMPRPTRSSSSSSSRRRGGNQSSNNDTGGGRSNAAAARRELPAQVRERQRAVAEREAARLARPEQRKVSTLGHADRKKSAVTSTPFGILATSRNSSTEQQDTTTTWCGPFTVARQMMAAREEAKRKREAEEEEENQTMQHPLNAIMEEVSAEQKSKQHPSVLWKSRLVTPDRAAAKGSKKPKSSRVSLPVAVEGKKIPSLYQLCVDFVVRNFEHVESLGNGIDHSIRTTIAKELAGLNRFDAIALNALVEPDMEALELVDCADIPQEALCDVLTKTARYGGLRYLALDQAGRCFGSKAVETLLNPHHLRKHLATDNQQQQPTIPLFALSIGGAYLLRDADASKLIAALSPTLQSLAWKACPLLGLEMCKAISSVFGQPKHTLLEFSLEDMTLSRESWEALAGQKDDKPAASSNSSSGWQCNLKSLSLKRVMGLQDDIVISILSGAPNLEHLDLSDNHELTDACLGPLRSIHAYSTLSSSPLRTLHLSNLKQLSSIGLETLFTHGLEGMGPPPQLKVLSLNHLDAQAVTDQVMESVIQSASRKPSDNTTSGSSAASSGLSLLGGLVRLELQGSAITDNTLEQIAATSAKTLEYFNVSFCPHISNQGLGYLVDQVGTQLDQVQIWGCAQITEEFWNGHRRVVGGGGSGGNNVGMVVPLKITGAWMKKSGISSIRS
jgi:hypothetical protein